MFRIDDIKNNFIVVKIIKTTKFYILSLFFISKNDQLIKKILNHLKGDKFHIYFIKISIVTSFNNNLKYLCHFLDSRYDSFYIRAMNNIYNRVIC